jgi:hypothetical protein
MKNYYFTFGQEHYNNDGETMKNHYVKVVAENYDKARSLFIRKFSMVFMPKPDKFSFQYGEEDFLKIAHYFHQGVFTTIAQ